MRNISHVKCIIPFYMMSIHHHGDCFSCCPTWAKLGRIGKLTRDSAIMEIWNNKKMQYLRRAVLDDRLEKVCDFKYCPIASKNEDLDLESMKNNDPKFNHIIDQIMAGQVILDQPPYKLEVADFGGCNLKCVMCNYNDRFVKDDALFHEMLFTKLIPEVLPGISRISLMGNGEVFFDSCSRKFLQSLDPELYPSLKIQLKTNGIMLTPKLWESISHNRYESISVSIDAASKAAYEKIRKNGNWDVLRRNLEFISELRRLNYFENFSINFVVMKSNYREMKDFVELGLSLGCDRINFQKIYGLVDLRENINFTSNKRIFIEIANILSDPIFDTPGVDTGLLDEYRKYAGKVANFQDDLRSQVKEWLFSIPMKVNGFFDNVRE